MTYFPFSCRFATSVGVVFAALALALGGCSSLDRASAKVAGVVNPYSIEIVQGNVVTREQLAALPKGAPRAQVQAILGTPLLMSPFHAQRWDYAFTIKRQGMAPQSRHVTVVFNGDRLESIDADTLPSEADFVGSLRTPVVLPAAKPLEASAEALAKFPAPKPVPALPVPVPTGAVSYPPLEPAAK